MSLYRSCGYGQCHVFLTCIIHDISTHYNLLHINYICIIYIFTNLFIGYDKNRVCHGRLVHAIEMGQRFTCCQIDVALLLVVHIPQHSSIAFLYVAPLLTYTQCLQLPNTNHACAHNSQQHFNVYMRLGKYAKGFAQESFILQTGDGALYYLCLY